MEVQQLVKEAKQGSIAAQKCLFDQFYNSMFLLCRRYAKTIEDAEEIVLDGFYKFFSNIPSFKYNGDASVFAWLKKIMINECLMALRKKTSFTMVSEMEAEEIAFDETALNDISAKQLMELIVDLPVGYRTVFNLYEMEGFAHKEIAGMLGISESTSRSQLSKAKTLLQKKFFDYESGYGKQQCQ